MKLSEHVRRLVKLSIVAKALLISGGIFVVTSDLLPFTEYLALLLIPSGLVCIVTFLIYSIFLDVKYGKKLEKFKLLRLTHPSKTIQGSTIQSNDIPRYALDDYYFSPSYSQMPGNIYYDHSPH